MSRLIDTHFHLDYYKNYKEIADKITEMGQYTICVTNSPGVFNSCKKMLPESKYLKFAIGLHPLDDIREKDLKDFAYLLSSARYVGEVGLDFSHSKHAPKHLQVKIFDEVVRLSTEKNKLMTVHVRNAEDEAIRIISKYHPQKCIIHWYTGNEEDILTLSELGCYFSVNSNMVNSKNKKMYTLIPKERILVESDGPFTKVNGKTFKPELLEASYEQIALFFGYNKEFFSNLVINNFRVLLEK